MRRSRLLKDASTHFAAQLLRDVGTTIYTYAGGGVGDGGQAVDAVLLRPGGVRAAGTSSDSRVFIADTRDHRIRELKSDGSIITIAGTGESGYFGDGGAATAAWLYGPTDMDMDGDGNLYIADTGNHCIRKVSADGTISTIAGTGVAGFTGDGGAATSATLNGPRGVRVDGAGGVWIADTQNHRVRFVNTAGVIATSAGTGVAGFSGDSGLANKAQLNQPQGLELSSAGSVYIADTGNSRIRRINNRGVIATVAGTDSPGYSGDGGSATMAQLKQPCGVRLGVNSSFYIADTGNSRVRFVNSFGNITTLAGSGTAGYNGDGGAATSAQLNAPADVHVFDDGSFLIADTLNDRVRRVTVNRTMQTAAGDGAASFCCDGAQAASARIALPLMARKMHDNTVYIADNANSRVRRVDTDDVIATVAGNGSAGYSGDGGPATEAMLNAPADMILAANGKVYIADSMNHRVRYIDADGNIFTAAGNGTAGYAGDGGAGVHAMLNTPTGLALDANGNLLIADSKNNRIRLYNTTSGMMSVIAGSAQGAGFSGDGGAATSAQLSLPTGVAVDTLGNILIADSKNQRIRRIDNTGTIHTYAGNGDQGYGGDGASALDASFNVPHSVAADANGDLFVADSLNQRIRRVRNDGIIVTVAGNGESGYKGDNADATSAMLTMPLGVSTDGNGNLLIADTGNNRIRAIGVVNPHSEPRLSPGAIAGIVIGSVVAAGVLLFAFTVCIRRARRSGDSTPVGGAAYTTLTQ